MAVEPVHMDAGSTAWQTKARGLSAVIASIVLIDATMVGAPALGVLALPFLVAAVGLRKGHLVTMILLLLSSLLYVVLAVNYAASNGFDAEESVDLVFAYVGGPLAAALAVLLAMHLPKARR
jgi:hypothetical protein